MNGNKRDSFKSKANIKRIRSHSKYYYTVERETGEWTAFGEFFTCQDYKPYGKISKGIKIELCHLILASILRITFLNNSNQLNKLPDGLFGKF